LYKLIYLAGFLIRQFLLPNPFEPLGDKAFIANLLVGGAFWFLSFLMTGIIYKPGSAPALGCFIYNITYALNTGITYLVMLAYPTTWLMIVIAAVYLIIYVVAAVFIRRSMDF
jgi:hypothetical protein